MYATRAEGEMARLPGVTTVVPNARKLELVEGLLPLLTAPASAPTTTERFGGGEGACGDRIQPGASGRNTYTLRVQTGCDEVCAYCIIPSTRGSGRSMPVDQVLGEVDRIAGDGFKEASLTGVHIGSYGRDLASPRHCLRCCARWTTMGAT